MYNFDKLNILIFDLDWYKLIMEVIDVNYIVKNFILIFLGYVSECIFEEIIDIRLSDKLWFDLILCREICI